jgi:hypothetical protein
MTRRCLRAFRVVLAAVKSTLPLAVTIAGEARGQQHPDSGSATATNIQAIAGDPFSILDDYQPVGSLRERGDVLSTLRPIVRAFDFDSLDLGPNALPPRFFRYIAPSQGFPPFGEMRVTRGAGYAAQGAPAAAAGALQFELAGGSMAARISTSVVPVLPWADYIVACRTRGEGLVHARTRLVAWLCDSSGREIPGSRGESRCAKVDDSWQTLSLEIHGRFGDAADLVFELQLVQPQHQSTAHADGVPNVQDVAGRAWFDDVTISHMPRVTMGLPGGAGVVRCGAPAEFLVQVNEVATQHLTARLRIFDIDGRPVFDRRFPAPRGRQTTTIQAALVDCGWYRAVLDVLSASDVARRRWVDFVVVPANRRDSSGAPNPFGVWVADPCGQPLAHGRLAIEALRPGLAVVPAWDITTTLANLPAQVALRRGFADAMLRQGIDVHFSLAQTPEELARSVGQNARGVLEVLARDMQSWQPYLDELLLQYGLTVGGWHIGASNDYADLNTAAATDIPVQLERAVAGMAEYAPNPELHLVWPVQQSAIDERTPAAITLHVPSQVQPSAITEYLRPWLARGSPQSTTVMLDVLPADLYAPRQRMIDAMLRGLHAWRAGAPAIVIDQPWASIGQTRESSPFGAEPVVEGRLQPGPEFAAWRTLAEQLTGRRFEAELSLGEGVHGWVTRGRDSGDSALIAWCDRESSASAQRLHIQLASGAVTAVDGFGNQRVIEPGPDGLHTLPLTDIPVFIQNVSLELVMFRGGLRIEPEFVSAAFKVHEHQIVLHNPWESAIAGSIRLTGPADLVISPSVLEFSIAGRSETRLPVSLIPQRGILAGNKTIRAQISVNAERLHTLAMDLNVDVGLKDIELTATWTTGRNPITGTHDLIISPAVTNHSTQAVHLDIDLLADGVQQIRRTIAGLQPGQTQTRTLRIPNGAAVLAGKQVRLGVAARDGVARLNKVITIAPRSNNTVADASQ